MVKKSTEEKILSNPKEAISSIATTIKDHPVEAELVATGPEDPAAWAAGAELLKHAKDDFEKKIAEKERAFEEKERKHKEKIDAESKLREEKDAEKAASEEEKEKALKAKASRESVSEPKVPKRGSSSMSSGLMDGVSTPRTKEPTNYGGMGGLFIFAVVVQLFDVISQLWYGIARESTLGPFTALYLSIATWAFFKIRKDEENAADKVKRLVLFFTVSFIYAFLPFILNLIPILRTSALGPSLFSWVSFFLAFLPFWPLYIAHHSGSPTLSHKATVYTEIVTIGVLIVILWSYFTSISASNAGQITGGSRLLDANPVISFLVDKMVKTSSNIMKSFKKLSVTNFLNSTGLNYYTGTVDENEKAPVGLYIDNVRPSDKYFFTNNPVTIWADIRGKSFNEKLVARPECFIDKNPAFRAKANPSEFSFFGEDQDTLDCTFESLPKGSHNVVVAATFEFETWGYVTYTFVDQELDRAMQSQGKDINSELDIPKMPQAVFTNGPVFLGMGAQLDMPIGIDVIKNNRDATVGVQIDNKWSDGEPAFIKSFELGIPDDFQLYGCDRWYPANQKVPTRKEDGYNYYVFLKEELEDERVPFKSVTCRVHVIDATKFLSGTQKVQRTFLGKAKYAYTLKKSTAVVVRE